MIDWKAPLEAKRCVSFLYIPLALTPMIPIIFALRAFLRFFHRIDELQKRIQLEALAWSFGVTCVVTFGYGVLEEERK